MSSTENSENNSANQSCPENMTLQNKSMTIFRPIIPSEMNNNPTVEDQRQRVNRACDECRRKKVKCQRLNTLEICKNCIASKKGCTYNTRSKKRGPRRGYIGILENRLKRIEKLLGSLNTNSNNELMKTKESINRKDHNHIETTYVENKKVKIYNDRHPRARVEWFLNKVRQNYLSNEGHFLSEYSLISFIAARKINTLKTKELLSQYGIELQYNPNGDHLLLKKENSFNDRRKEQIQELIEIGVIQPHETIKDVDDWIYRVTGIKRYPSDQLLRVYFAYIHPLLPIVNKKEFLEEYRGIRVTFPAGPILNAIYGASIRYIENCQKFNGTESLDNGYPWDLPKNSVDKLFKNLFSFLKLKYVPRLSSIQAAIITHSYYANVDSLTKGWLFNCIIVRMSQDLGLHRSTKDWNISQEEKETRRMVFWFTYIIDRWSCAGTGRPLTIFDEDCDEMYPSENVNLDEVMDRMTETDRYLPRFPSLDEYIAEKATGNVIPMYQPIIQLLKLSEILGRILQGIYTPMAKKHSAKYGSDAIIAYLDDALSKWRASLPPLLEISTAGEKQGKEHIPLLTMSGLICISYCTVLILLHRPFIENNGKSKLSSQSSHTICTSAAIRIIEVFEKMHYQDFFMISWDAIIADVAKSHLIRALALVDKLCLLLPTTKNMVNILRKMIMLSSIFENDPEFENINIGCSKDQCHTSSNSQDRNDYDDDEHDSNTRETHQYSFLEQFSEAFQKSWVSGNGHLQTKDMGSPLWNEDWLSQLYTPSIVQQQSFTASTVNQQNTPILTQTPSIINYTAQQQYQQIPNKVDAYSIRQFGFNTLLNNDEQQEIDFSMQPTFTTSGNNSAYYPTLTMTPTDKAALFPMYSLGFEIPNFYFEGASNIEETNFWNNFNHTQTGSINETHAYNNNTVRNDNNDLSANFRLNPENPFWGIPSSMEMNEWNDYFFPRQQQ
ncbi:fungal-specific transcription factor domain-containing protein [Cokeromyces recurvatus]|uniref:fungal-specific transcription factor domain-containing protein n=1 Tax=Cokeromyces recurvatus TaxID=90255 RepID=UPI002220A7A3|nr:fungal-specific transcription factor domain-containing protein [Cokeromyces recurvatus]KAI7899467.1 fungal-specific transcription factor domain-containing protein [Cokeromyces recurvatus]